MRVRKVVLCLLSFRRSFFVAYFERYPQFHVNKILQIISWGEIIKGETHLPVLALQRMGEKETLTRHESQVRHRKKTRKENDLRCKGNFFNICYEIYSLVISLIKKVILGLVIPLRRSHYCFIYHHNMRKCRLRRRWVSLNAFLF